MASYLTGFLPGSVDKAWGDLVGPPAIGKTEILRALDDGQHRTIMIDNLTENAFASAMRDNDNPDADFSLLHRLSSDRPPVGPKTLVVKEYSSLLNMRKEKVDAVFSQLRAAYDGDFTTAAGNIEGSLDTKKNLQFGMITACTERLDDFRETNQTLGERSLVCRIGRHTKTYKARQAIADHVIQGDRLRKAQLQIRIKMETQKAIKAAVASIKEAGMKVAKGNEFKHKVGRVATLSTSVRSSPLSRKSYCNLAEGPGRLVGQLVAFGDCRVIFDGRRSWNETDYHLVRRIAQDTMPPKHLKAIRALWRGSRAASTKPMETATIIQQAKCDDEFYRQLQQWAIIEILVKTSDKTYALHPDFAQDIEYTGFMEGL